MKVYSFVASSPVNSFSANLKDFFNYLANSKGYPASSQYLISMHFRFLYVKWGLQTLMNISSLPIRYRAFHGWPGDIDGLAVVGKRELN